eukprot:1961889-Pyramimonas_sp.AAC.1
MAIPNYTSSLTVEIQVVEHVPHDIQIDQRHPVPISQPPSRLWIARSLGLDTLPGGWQVNPCLTPKNTTHEINSSVL